MIEPEAASLRSSDGERIHTNLYFYPLVPVPVNSNYEEHNNIATDSVHILHTGGQRPNSTGYCPKASTPLSL